MIKFNYDKSDIIVFWLYVIGILVAIAVAATPYILRVIAQFRSLDVLVIHRGLRFGFFIGSISHVLLLAGLSVVLAPVDKIRAGSKVQTAGYLHTLVAFVLIFAQIENEFTLDVVLYPMGAALITSILGWFLGGEIVARVGTQGISLQSEAEKVASELDGFRHAIHKIHEGYVKTLSEANKEFSSLYKKQGEMYKKVSKLAETADELVKSLQSASNKMNKYLGDDFEKSITNISEKFTKLTKEVEDSANAANQVADYLKQAQILITQLEKLLDLVTERFDAHES